MNEITDHWLQGLNSNQTSALRLLGQGISSVMVASTLGVTESLVSQFLSDPRFAAEVTKLKLATLQKQTSIDNKYIEAEEKLVDKLIKAIPLMNKPMDILRGIQVVNATKRRGMSDAPVNNSTTQIVQINLPGAFAARFVTNSQNQIVEVQDNDGSRSLITTTPQALDRLASEVNRNPTITSEPGWETSSSPEYLLQQASERVKESGVSEVIPEGLRRSFAAQREIAADDL